METKLTQKQQDIMSFIQEFIMDHRYPPTVRDIQRGCEISSTSVVDYNLRRLQKLGYLKREPDVSRGIELIGEGLRGMREDIVSIPIMGSIAAGEPLHVPDASGSVDGGFDRIDLPASLAGDKPDLFALRVKGTSMIDALVADGDLVIIEPASDASDGEMVAAWLDELEETTLKRFYLEGDTVRLQPENESMSPLRVPASEISVRGKVVGVVRTL
jgi:repressor LexA